VTGLGTRIFKENGVEAGWGSNTDKVVIVGEETGSKVVLNVGVLVGVVGTDAGVLEGP